MCILESDNSNVKTKYDIFYIDSDEKREGFISFLLINNPSYDNIDENDVPKILNDPHTYNILKEIFNKIKTFVAVVEYNYVDKYYRDSYYEYYSFRYFDYPRDCIRVCLFENDFQEKSRNKLLVEINTEILQKYFIGSMVLKPIPERWIGHTLIDPKYILCESQTYYRISKFRVNLAGHKLYVCAFPFTMQDLATTRCAEVTLTNLMEYYNNEYSDYSRIYPSDILEISRNTGYQRALPSQGLTYTMMSKILIHAGFEPRCINLSSYNMNNGEKIDGELLKKILYYYVESGIPIGVGMEIQNNSQHSCVCIGHGKIDYNLIDTNSKIECHKVDDQDSRKDIYCYDSASLVNEFVLVDDNQLPYTLAKYEKDTNDLSFIAKSSVDIKYKKLKSLIIPLYKKMCLTPEMAKEICMNLLAYKSIGIKQVLGQNIASKDNPIVIRIFMCSSNSFKNSRINDLSNSPKIQSIYSNLDVPKFIWVCEVYLKEDFKKNEVISEIVLDATASSDDGTLSLILINYGKKVIYKKNKKTNTFLTHESDKLNKFNSYKNNLSSRDNYDRFWEKNKNLKK